MKKSFLLLIFLFSLSMEVLAQEESQVRNTIINNGIGLGGALAIAISWSRNRSIAWAILHGILGWFYVIYYFIDRRPEERSK